MIKVSNYEVTGWEHVVRGMRNPLNSWDRSDSCFCHSEPECEGNCKVNIGLRDHDLMMRLRNAGSDHRKFMRMITVYMDITAPLYWWKEYDTYKVGTVANSCSTMHKIHEKEFTMDDFSREHIDGTKVCAAYGGEMLSSWDVLYVTVAALNHHRRMFLETNDKCHWHQMIQLLPSSYNQKRTVMLNYEVLANIYAARKVHKLDEWRELCKFIETLPYSELITGPNLMDIPICKGIMDEAERRVKMKSD